MNPTTAQAGDTIVYTITVTNTGETVIPAGTEITDTMTITKKDGSTETIVTKLKTTKPLKTGESEMLTYTYTVKEEDKLLKNVVTAEIPHEDPPPVEVPVSDIDVEKVTTSEPENGEAYVVGETITYSIVVTNTGDTVLTNVVVTDELTGDEWTIPSLAPGASQSFDTSYEVTEEDAEAGSVLNVVTAVGHDPDDVPVEDEH